MDGSSLLKPVNHKPIIPQFTALFAKEHKPNGLTGWNEPSPGNRSKPLSEKRPAQFLLKGYGDNVAICDTGPIIRERDLLIDASTILRNSNSQQNINQLIADPKTRQYIVYAAKDSNLWIYDQENSHLQNGYVIW